MYEAIITDEYTGNIHVVSTCKTTQGATKASQRAKLPEGFSPWSLRGYRVKMTATRAFALGKAYAKIKPDCDGPHLAAVAYRYEKYDLNFIRGFRAQLRADKFAAVGC